MTMESLYISSYKGKWISNYLKIKGLTKKVWIGYILTFQIVLVM